MENQVKRVGRPCSATPTQSISIRLPENAIARMCQLAAKRGVTTNYMARIIILRGLNQDYSLGTAMETSEVQNTKQERGEMK